MDSFLENRHRCLQFLALQKVFLIRLEKHFAIFLSVLLRAVPAPISSPVYDD